MDAPNLTVTAIDHRTWCLDEGGVRFFLLVGDERALLVDSGMRTHDARDRAAQLTDLPIALFNTHCDMDHVGSNEQFEEVWVSPMELVHPQAPHDSRRVRPVWDGDVIDLGNRPLECIALPGHTPGSMALLDRSSGMHFSGDPIQRDGRIFMFGPMRNLAAYIHSLKRLSQRAGEITAIYPSHADCPIPPEAIGDMIEAAEKIERGECQGRLHDAFGHQVMLYDAGCTAFLGEAK